MKELRLQKYLADIGYSSRRNIEKLITQNKVIVNNEIAKLGIKVKNKDEVLIENESFIINFDNVKNIKVLIYNKRPNEIVSRNDPLKRKTVFDKLPTLNNERWVSVGRLDFNTSGLLLFTNSGEYANELMHPKSNIERIYILKIKNKLTESILKKLTNGIILDKKKSRFNNISLYNINNKSKYFWYQVSCTEGRYHFVKKMFLHFDIEIDKLKRVQYGKYILPSNLNPGEYTVLAPIK